VKVCDGTYQDFLDRGGWKDEAIAIRRGQNSGRKGNNASKKDFKRMKADLINSRSRTLTPLTAKISEVEESITKLEQDIGRDTQALIDASVKGDGESIKRFTKSIYDAREKVDIFFDELEALTDTLDTKSREFDESFEALKATEG
jgi:predicted translin family RNA/ssDNA-binding protein